MGSTGYPLKPAQEAIHSGFPTTNGKPQSAYPYTASLRRGAHRATVTRLVPAATYCSTSARRNSERCGLKLVAKANSRYRSENRFQKSVTQT